MRGVDKHHHPAEVMGKKSSPCGRTDKAVIVEDHGNGFMFVGTSDAEQCRRILADYVDDPEAYIFQGVPGGTTEYGRYACRVWLAVNCAQVWDGATDHVTGKPLPRSGPGGEAA